MQTWQRNPQNAEDEHEWTRWFAPATDYRDVIWDIHLDGLVYTTTARKVRAHG